MVVHTAFAAAAVGKQNATVSNWSVRPCGRESAIEHSSVRCSPSGCVASTRPAGFDALPPSAFAIAGTDRCEHGSAGAALAVADAAAAATAASARQERALVLTGDRS